MSEAPAAPPGFPQVGPRTNGSSDVGGAAELGPVPIHDDAAPFHAPWEGVTMAMCMSSVVAGTYFPDHHRAVTAAMHPVPYLASTYFEQWLYTHETLLIREGVITREEVEARMTAYAEEPDAPLPPGENEELLGRLKYLLAKGVPESELDTEPRHRVGDVVTTKVMRVEPGRQHTRLPGYAHGKTGVIEAVNPPQPLAEALVAGEGFKPEHVYSVRFLGSELWPEGRDEDSVIVEVWESYIEEAR